MAGKFNPWGKNSKNTGEFVEEIKVSGKNLVNEVERILRQGEVQRIRIRQGNKILLDLPVLWVAAGVLALPSLAILATVGALAAVVTECTIEIVRGEDKRPPITPAQPKSKPTAPPSSPDDIAFR